jgi:hypothetical protein
VPGAFKSDAPNQAIQAFANLVKSDVCATREDLITQSGYAVTSIDTMISKAVKEGYLTEEDTLRYNNIHLLTFHTKLAELVKQKKTKQELLAFCKKNENKNQQKSDKYLSQRYLMGIVAKLYRDGLLTSEDTAYLKDEKTVIARNGQTKDRIVAFLTTRALRPAPDSIKSLLIEYNQYAESVGQIRDITDSTFRQHIKELNDQERLTPAQFNFFESCKSLPGAPKIR